MLDNDQLSAARMQHFGTLGRIPSVEGAVASLDGLAIPVTEPLEEAYRALLPTLVRRLALIVRDVDEAQDLAQQTFLRATETWPPSKGQPAGAWLTTVGVRLAIDAVRRRKRWGFLPLRESDATWALTVDPDVWRALGTLDVRTRAALVLTVLDGYTQAEVAEMLGVTRGGVASMLSRGRDRLRPLLEEGNQ